MRAPVWTISSLVRYLKDSLDNDMVIQSILIKGEVSNFTHHRSGHLYFSLKDRTSKMNCVMFASHASKLKIQVKEGMQVIVQAKVSLYEQQGNLQLYVSAMQSDGIGDLYLQYEELKKKLSLEGLFQESHKKKPLPYPMRIGVISAKTGAAIQDVLSIIARRWPLCEVSVYPSLVQGDMAANNLIERLKEADTASHDVLLLVRGGGSLEDLWCFNSEALARCIYDLNTCVVSGVGHESDTTLVDFVSDVRCPTPSAAAEFVTPNYIEVQQNISHYRQRLSIVMNRHLMQCRSRMNQVCEKVIFQNSEALIQNDKMRLMMAIKSLEQCENRLVQDRYRLEKGREKLSFLASSLVKEMKQKNMIQKDVLLKIMQDNIQENKKDMKEKISLLDAFSPLKILQRGYAIAMHEEKVIQSIHDVYHEEEIQIRVSDGKIHAKVIERKS